MQHRGFAGPHDRGRGAQTHQLQRAHTLVKLHPSAAQNGRINDIDIRDAERLGFLEVAPQGLVGRLQRPPQLVMNPEIGRAHV